MWGERALHGPLRLRPLGEQQPGRIAEAGWALTPHLQLGLLAGHHPGQKTQDERWLGSLLQHWPLAGACQLQ